MISCCGITFRASDWFPTNAINPRSENRLVIVATFPTTDGPKYRATRKLEIKPIPVATICVTTCNELPCRSCSIFLLKTCFSLVYLSRPGRSVCGLIYSRDFTTSNFQAPMPVGSIRPRDGIPNYVRFCCAGSIFDAR